jgi:hypothetical protein
MIDLIWPDKKPKSTWDKTRIKYLLFFWKKIGQNKVTLIVFFKKNGSTELTLLTHDLKFASDQLLS